MNASDTFMANSISGVQEFTRLEPQKPTTLLEYGARTWDVDFIEDIVHAMSITSILEGLGEDSGDVRALLEGLVNEYIYLLHPLPYYPDLIKWHGSIKPRDMGSIIERMGEDGLFELLGKVLLYKEEFDEGYIDFIGVMDVCSAFEKFAHASGVPLPDLGDGRDKGYRCIVASALLLSKIVFG